MTKSIPKNQIMKSANYGYLLGDLAESFGIDISSSFGSIRASERMKLITKPTDMQVPLDFAYYNDKYYFCSDTSVYVGANAPDDGFSKDVTSGAPSSVDTYAGGLEVFNGSMYVADGTGISKLASTTWSSPAGLASKITASSTHLMKTFGNRLYITDSGDKIYSISTSDTIADSGQFSADWALGSSWVATFLDVAQGAIFAGYLNTDDGRGIVFQWDGDTADTASRRIDLEAGVVAGCVLDNIPYIIDTHGRLKRYSGASFTEVDRLFKKENEAFNGIRDGLTTIDRPIHPNGMIPTEDGNIMFLFKNGLASTSSGVSVNHEDTIPSGIYEYNTTTGLNHRHALSYVAIGNTTLTDYGQQRLNAVGALFYRQPNSSPYENGALMAGCQYFTDATTKEYGVFSSDTFDTTQKYGSYTTEKIFSTEVQDQWSKIYTIYKTLLDSGDKIVIKYRTETDVPTEVTATWTDTDTFTTTTSLASYAEGDEVQFLQGTGGGKSAHISSISESGGTYTVNLDDTFTGATGTALAKVSKWIKAGEITQANDDLRYKGLTIDQDNASPWIQFKVCMQFTGKNEIYKHRVVNKSLIKE